MSESSELAERIADALSRVPLPPGDLGLAVAQTAYRGSRAARRVRHQVGRLIVSVMGAAAVLACGGVAAAYAASLPSPAQRLAHHLLAPLGVPAPRPHHRPETTQQRRSAAVAMPPRQQNSPEPRPVLTALRPFGRAGASDLLTAHAQPGVVVLLEKETRGGWRTIASAQVPAAGRVDFLVRPRVNTVFAAQIADRTHARSTPVKVTVEPELVARVQVVAGRWYVDVRSVGAAPGDRVRIVALEARPVVVTSGRVDRRGVARLVLHDASPKLHYRLELAATRSHPMVSIVLRVPHPTRKAAGRAER